MFKRIAPLLLAVGIVVGFAPSAFAGGSGPQPSATVAGDTVTVTRTGCDASTQASAELKKDGSTVQSDSATTNGSGEVTFTFENVDDGTYSAETTCFVNDEPSTQVAGNIVVQDDGATATTAGSGTLPNTGSDSSISMARIGIVLVAAGGVAVYAAQRRRKGSFIDA